MSVLQVLPVAEGFLKHPEVFAGQDTKSGEKATKAAETLFAYAKANEPRKTGALPTLLVDGFDSEQIWEQLQLLNIPTLNYLDNTVNKLLKDKELQKELEEQPKKKKMKVAVEDEEEGDESDEEGDGFGEDDDGEEESEGEEGEEALDDSFVEDGLEDGEGESDEDEEMGDLGDDNSDEEGGSDEEGPEEGEQDIDFFDMDEMNKFADEAENSGEEDDFDEDEDEEDLDDITKDSGESATMDTYEDFFDQPSTFGTQAAKMKKKIAQLEDAAVAEKDWTLTGEVGRGARPKDSLLEEDLIFDFATKVKPVITEEFTHSLEDIIKRRIIEGTFDDVIRKTAADLNPKFKPQAELDSTQNLEGLGKLYEDQFMKQAYGMEETPKLLEAHAHIDKIFNALCVELDGLSHFHFTPQLVKPDAKEQRKNVASVNMEEKVPMAVSNATLLAPHEVHQQPLTLKAADEYTREERKALRQRIKSKVANKNEAAKNDPNTKEKAEKKTKTKSAAISSLKGEKGVTLLPKQTGKLSSTTFFKSLQDEAQANKGGKRAEPKRNSNPVSNKKSASQLKL